MKLENITDKKEVTKPLNDLIKLTKKMIKNSKVSGLFIDHYAVINVIPKG